jgi:hypothetical protein
MAQKRETHPDIHIDDLHLIDDGFVHSFKATWQEAGLLVTVYLDIVDRGNWRPGHHLSLAYELTSYVGTVSGRPVGSIQAETGSTIARELRAQVLVAMIDAGWQQVDTTRWEQDIYQYRPGPGSHVFARSKDAQPLALNTDTIQINQAQLHSTRERDPNYEGLSFARWGQQGVLALAWLEEVARSQGPRGISLDGAGCTLTCTYDRVAHMGMLGPRQEALGQEMIDQFRPLLVKELLTAGWRVVHKTKTGQDIWLPPHYLQRHPGLTQLTPNGMEEVIGPEVSESDLPALAGDGQEDQVEQERGDAPVVVIDDLSEPPMTIERKLQHLDPRWYHAKIEQGDVKALITVRHYQSYRFPGGYILDERIDRVDEFAPGRMGRKQEARARELLDQLREQVHAQLVAAGWEQRWKTAYDKDIWVYVGATVVPAAGPAAIAQEVDIAPATGAGAEVPGDEKSAITMDDLQPGSLRHAAHWIEDGIQVTLRLEARGDDQAQGYTLETWYVGRHASARPLGKKQQALAGRRVFPLRHRFMLALEDAGWTVAQQEGVEVWRHSSHVSTTSTSEHDQDDQPGFDQGDQPEPELRQSHLVEVVGSDEAKGRGQQPAYSREVFTREVTFTCIVCNTTVAQQRFPGHTPLYCSQFCKEERVAARTRERVARHREKKKVEAAAQEQSSQ